MPEPKWTRDDIEKITQIINVGINQAKGEGWYGRVIAYLNDEPVYEREFFLSLGKIFQEPKD